MGMKNCKELARLKPGERCKPRTDTGPGLTKQEFAKDADINVLMKRYGVTGIPVNFSSAQPVFADVSKIGDFQDVLRRVNAAEVAFNGLPPELRSMFRNDAATLVEWLQDDSNYDEAVKLGLIAEKPKEVPKDPPKADVPPKAA